MRLTVEFAQLKTGFGAHGSPRGIDPHAFHGRKIDHKTALTNRLPGNAVSSAANRKEEIVLARKFDTSDDVSRSGAACNKGWPPVDHGVRNGSGSVVSRLPKAK